MGRRSGLGQLLQSQLGLEVGGGPAFSMEKASPPAHPLSLDFSLGQLSKTQGLTDWRMRPLSEDQVAYAIGDVAHLHEVCSEAGQIHDVLLTISHFSLNAVGLLDSCGKNCKLHLMLSRKSGSGSKKRCTASLISMAPAPL